MSIMKFVIFNDSFSRQLRKDSDVRVADCLNECVVNYRRFILFEEQKMKNVYVRCPRCELNFILKKDKYCNVCKQEMSALATNYADDVVKEMGLCPICKVNYITEDETVCSTCMSETDLTEDELDALYGGVVVEQDETTDDEITDGDDEEELEIISMSEIGDDGEEVDELDDDEEEKTADPLDDFDDSIDDADDEDEEDEEFEETYD